MFDTFFGLPLHPLVVHAAVVLLPLVAIGVIALALRPAWRPRFALPLLGLLVVGAASAVVAMLSGSDFAERVGTPEQHMELGTILAYTSIAFLLLAGGWLWWVRRDATPTGPQNSTGWVAALASAVVLLLTVLVGHSGATAAWSHAGNAAPAPSASPMTTTAYTLDMLAEHDTPDDCWAAVDGSMYDLTDWIAEHPGGADRIDNLCGTDATAAFTGQHQGASKPADALSRHLLGPIS